MANMPEVAALVVGSIASLRPVTKYGSQDPDGLKVVVTSGDGATEVKVPQALALSLGDLAPAQPVAWIVRYGYWSQEERSGLFCYLVGMADRVHLDAAAAAMGARASK